MSEWEDEMAAITEMLIASEEYGLQTEVVHSFACALRSGVDLVVATEMAMNDWDII